jgi:hypothetical protein
MPRIKHGTRDGPTKFYKCQFCAEYAIILKHNAIYASFIYIQFLISY